MAAVTLEQFFVGLKKMPQVFKAELKNELPKAVNAIVAQSRENEPVRTGTLRRNTYAEGYKVAGDNISVRLIADTPYAHIIHSGMREREVVIEPKRAKVLSWVGYDGKRHFAKRVVIPAGPINTKGVNFFGRAYDAKKNELTDAVVNAAVKAWNRI